MWRAAIARAVNVCRKVGHSVVERVSRDNAYTGKSVPLIKPKPSSFPYKNAMVGRTGPMPTFYRRLFSCRDHCTCSARVTQYQSDRVGGFEFKNKKTGEYPFGENGCLKTV